MCKPRIILILLLLSATVAIAQNETPLQRAGGKGHFVAPVLKYTVINDQGVLMLGGRGGWNVNASLTLRGGLYATMTEVDAPEDAVPNAPGPLDLKLESFGFELEYAPRPTAQTFLTLYAFVGGAAGHYVRDKTREQHGETDFMFLLEPGVGVERRIIDWLHLNLSVSYRLVNGVEQPLLKDSDFNGPAATLAIKFGRF
jgi:hypothetical protein